MLDVLTFFLVAVLVGLLTLCGAAAIAYLFPTRNSKIKAKGIYFSKRAKR